MDYRIEYIKAIEFVESMFKYTINRYHKINWGRNIIQEELPKDILDFAPSKKVKSWLKYVDDNISPIFRNDVIFIANTTIDNRRFRRNNPRRGFKRALRAYRIFKIPRSQ